MKYISEFRDPALARYLAQRLADAVHPDRSYRFMEFCGGHTHALARYGVTAAQFDQWVRADQMTG